MPRRRVLSLEPLEARHSPSVTIVKPTTATFTDVDGDRATVTVSKGTLTAGLFTTATAGLGDQLQAIDLSGGAFDGASLTVTARRGPTGDGLVNVGFVNAAGHDLGAVAVAGDLGRINAGSGDPTDPAPALPLLRVRSLGRYGLDTQAAGGSLESDVNGRLGTLAVAGDVVGALVHVVGTIGAVGIGGSLTGGAVTNVGNIFSTGDMGRVRVGHDVLGGKILTGGKLAGVTVGGSLVGGPADGSGSVRSYGVMGPVRVGHDVLGGAGNDTGAIFCMESRAGVTIAGVTIGGSLIGGAGQFSGAIVGQGAIGPIRVGHDIRGGAGFNSGNVWGFGSLAGFAVGGSLVGGTAYNTGSVDVLGDLGPVRVGGDIVGGSIGGTTGDLGMSGSIRSSGRIAGVYVGGSVVAGTDTSTAGSLTDDAAIRAGNDIGWLTVQGSLVGNTNPDGDSPVVIAARGQEFPRSGVDLAIGRVTVGGRVEHARIMAGYDYTISSYLAPLNADAQIGPVTVGGDWVASDLVAGVMAGGDGLFGTADDRTIFGAGTTNDPNIVSRIAGVRVGGLVYGSPVAAGADHFGFVAAQVGAFTAGGVAAALHPGPFNDLVELAPTTGDVTIREAP